jgi:hypothetical protein
MAAALLESRCQVSGCWQVLNMFNWFNWFGEVNQFNQ